MTQEMRQFRKKGIRAFARSLGETYSDFVRWHKRWRGAWYFFRYSCLGLLGRLFSFDVLYLLRKDVVARAETHFDSAEILFEAATPNDYETIRRLNSSNATGYIETRLSNDELCYVARSRNGGLCAYFWVAPGERVFVHRSSRIRIVSDDVYIRDIMTLPECRGQGITPAFLLWIENELAKRGKRTMWAGIRGFNYSSQRSFAKSGFQVDEQIYYGRLPIIDKEVVVSRKKRGGPFSRLGFC